MDDIARYNQQRWDELARAGVGFSRPALELDEPAARKMVDAEGMLGDVAGKEVLCLAGGGGQQSAAFALLGATVTVLDLSEVQLGRDRQAAEHYGLKVRTVRGDMRDLSCLAEDAFDIVWHAHSLGFVPDAAEVFGQVARVLRDRGVYRVECHNPFVHGLDEKDWNGRGYPLRLPYENGEVVYDDPCWDISRDDGTCVSVRGPREFRHTLTTIVNSLVEQGFVILRCREETGRQENPEPGTWEHFLSVTAPFLTFWGVLRPEVFSGPTPVTEEAR